MYNPSISVNYQQSYDIYIDDLEQIITDVLIRMFADDTKVAKIVENEKDGEEMQKTINALADWA